MDPAIDINFKFGAKHDINSGAIVTLALAEENNVSKLYPILIPFSPTLKTFSPFLSRYSYSYSNIF
jgi:hypothetical protein